MISRVLLAGFVLTGWTMSVVMTRWTGDRLAGLAAGAMLTTGKVIASRQMWMGRPASYARDLTEAALEDMRAGVAGYVINGKLHAAALHGQIQG